MSGNTSWLKKSSGMLPRRTFGLPNADGTLTMQGSEDESQNTFRPPAKRKSCLITKDIKYVVQQQTKKSRPFSTKASFKGRTLMMVEGRQSIAPVGTATRSHAPYMRPRAAASRPNRPLQVSTPLEAPRSILKSPNTGLRSLAAAKKVNFGSDDDEGIFPLEESTIASIPVPKIVVQPRVQKIASKRDASTNTPPITLESEEKPKDCDLSALIKRVEENIISTFTNKIAALEAKIDELEKNSWQSKNAHVQELNVLKTKFFSNLEDIREVSENVTPSIDGSSNVQTDDSGTPKCAMSSGLEKSSLSTQEQVPAADIHDQPLTPPQEQELEQSANGDDMKANENNEEMKADVVTLNSTSETNGSARKRRSLRSRANTPEPPKLRMARKRAIPRYLTTFELSSPRPKTRSASLQK